MEKLETVEIRDLYNQLLPSHIGNELAKKLLALQLFASPGLGEKLHILLCGETGVDKSGFLLEVSRVMPKSTYSARNVTRVGLNELMMSNSGAGIVCLHPDTKVLLGGIPTEIKNIKEGDGRIESLQKEGMQTIKNEFTVVSKRNWDGKIIRIRLNSGMEIKVTPNHLLLDGADLEWKQASELKEGGYVVAPLKINDFERDKEDAALADLDPKISYILGFIFGDGSVIKRTGRKNSYCLSITQSSVHIGYINRIIQYWNDSFPEPIRVYKRRAMKSTLKCGEVINGKEVYYLNSTNQTVIRLFKYLSENNWGNLLRLSNENLKAFLAGAFDADGCLSIKNCTKNGKGYKIAHVDWFLSNNKEVCRNILLALRRFDCYAGIRPSTNVWNIQITNRGDVLNLKNALSGYSLKCQKGIPEKIKDIGGTADLLPQKLVAGRLLDNKKKGITIKLVEAGLWSTFRSYIREERYPTRNQVEELMKIAGEDVELRNLLNRDYFLDKIVEIEELDYSGEVYDLSVPKTNNFIADGIFVHNCLDEIDKVPRDALNSLLEAMQSQTVSVDKHGVHYQAEAKVNILAACNPIGGRMPMQGSLLNALPFHEYLLARFHLIVPMESLDSDSYKIIGANMTNGAAHMDDDRRDRLRELIMRVKTQYAKVYVAKEYGERIGELCGWLRENSPLRDVVTPRLIEGFISSVKAQARMNGHSEVKEEDYKEVYRLYWDIYGGG